MFTKFIKIQNIFFIWKDENYTEEDFIRNVVSDNPKSILFIGNSYLYYNDSMHNHVEELMEDFYKDQEIVTKSATIGGSRLENHNIDHLLKPKNLQRKEQVDMVIMQGGSGEVIDKASRKKFIKTAVKYSK